MTQEALRMALEALEANDQLINGTGTKGGLVYCMDGYYSDCFDVDPINKQTEEAIAAIKEALAQSEQEPVADDVFKMIADMNPKPFQLSQRTWVGLTKEQLATTDWSADFRAGALWAEAKLKERNI